jgi:hypothetical protein
LNLTQKLREFKRNFAFSYVEGFDNFISLWAVFNKTKPPTMTLTLKNGAARAVVPTPFENQKTSQSNGNPIAFVTSSTLTSSTLTSSTLPNDRRPRLQLSSLVPRRHQVPNKPAPAQAPVMSAHHWPRKTKAVWVGGETLAHPKTLMKGAIPELQKQLKVPANQLEVLEMQVAQERGAQLMQPDPQTGAPPPLYDVATRLGYTTDRGILALAIAAAPCGAELASMMLGGIRQPALSRPVPDSVTTAIAQGKTLAQIVTNPAHACITSADIWAVKDAITAHQPSVTSSL